MGSWLQPNFWAEGCSKQRCGEVCFVHLCSLCIAQASRNGFLHFCFVDAMFLIQIVILVLQRIGTLIQMVCVCVCVWPLCRNLYKQKKTISFVKKSARIYEIQMRKKEFNLWTHLIQPTQRGMVTSTRSCQPWPCPAPWIWRPWKLQEFGSSRNLEALAYLLQCCDILPVSKVFVTSYLITPNCTFCLLPLFVSSETINKSLDPSSF